MAAEKETFGISGPTFLNTIDWNNSNHRRSIAASLIQGVYVLERDRQENRQGPLALALPWFDFFHFTLQRLLIDDSDKSYFGAVYEFKYPHPQYHYPGQTPPQYVVAIRGTANKSGSMTDELKQNLKFVVSSLEKSRRFQVGVESACDTVVRAGPGNVWLAGHSTGSSISLLIARHMAKSMGTHVETYLFNPPFTSAPIEMIKNEKVKMGLRLANSVVTAGLAIAANGGHAPKTKENDPFVVLSSWIPYLFINSNDAICSEYVGYFEHREKMKSIGAGKIEKLATKHSIGSIVSGARGKDSEALHLIPSAYLTINSSPLGNWKEAHGIHQWWKHDLEFKYKMYQYK